MPYQRVEELPAPVRNRYRGRCLLVFLRAFNEAAKSNPEEAAFKIAHAAAQRCSGERPA